LKQPRGKSSSPALAREGSERWPPLAGERAEQLEESLRAREIGWWPLGLIEDNWAR
jgi:hypothetical protein